MNTALKIVIFPVLTGLVVSVVTLWGQHFFLDTRLSLSFERLTEAHFLDAQTPADIYSIRLTNDGNREVHNVKVRIGVGSGTIDKINSDRSNDLVDIERVRSDTQNWNFRLPMLNPGHRITFNVLAHQTKAAALKFEALGDGVDAHELDSSSTEKTSFWVDFLSVILGAISALVSAIAVGSQSLIRWIGNSFGELRSAAVRASIPSSGAVTREMILRFLFRDDLVLVFQPKSEKGTKLIAFSPDGTIKIGRNANEDRWEISGDLVVLWDEHGHIHNRFFFNPNAQSLNSTNDPDVGAIRRHGILDQRIVQKTDWSEVLKLK
jgi:hypothetical protein